MKHFILLNLLMTIFFLSCARYDQEEIKGFENFPENEAGGPSGSAPGMWFSLPQELKIAHNFEEVEKDATRQMIQKWEEAYPEVGFFGAIGETDHKDTDNLSDYRDQTLGIYLSSNWFDEVSPRALAVTQYFGFMIDYHGEKRVQIVHADIIFNRRYHDFSVLRPVPTDTFHLPSIVLHELGHLLGLRHSLANDSIMFPSMSAETIRDDIGASDLSELKKIYQNIQTDSLVAPIYTGELVRGVIELMVGPSGEFTHKHSFLPIRGDVK